MQTLNEKDSPEKASYGSTFGKRLKELRESRDLRQNDLAKACGVAVASYANWEQGRALPPINKIPVLADFFGVSADYLLGVSKKQAAEELMERMGGLSEKSRNIVLALIDELLEKKRS